MTDAAPMHEMWQKLADVEQDLAHIRASAELQRRFAAAPKTSPAGYVLVLAAVDVRRAGYVGLIPARDLIELGRIYFARLRPDESASHEEFQAGITWASAGEEDQLPLLIKADGERYRASPGIGYEPDLPAVPEETWEWLFAHLPPEHLLRVGGTAVLAGNLAVAERAWMRGTEAEEEPIRRLAWTGLGELRIEQKDYDGAIQAFERADGDTLLPLVGATMLFNLGLLYDRRGDAQRARAYYQRAIDANDPTASPNAAFNLGLLLGELDDADGSEAAFKRAMKDDWLYERAAEAPYALGKILHRLGKLDRARTYYQQAIDTDDRKFASKAALALGRLCEEHDEDDDALAAYEQALASSEPETLAKAIWRFGRLAARVRNANMQTSCQRLLQRLPADLVPVVACQLAEWAYWYEKTDTMTIALFEQVMASGHEEYAPRAALFRGWVAQGYRGHRKARTAYQRAIDSGHSEYAPKAANCLGALLADRGDTDEALAAFALAQSSPQASPQVKVAAATAFNTGVLLEDLGRSDEAREAFEQAINAGDRYVTPIAVAYLARLLTRAQETDDAEALLRRWREVDDAELAESVAREVSWLQPDPSGSSHGRRFITGPW